LVPGRNQAWIGAPWIAAAFISINSACREVIELRSDVRHTGRGRDHRDELKQLCRSSRQREGEDVLSPTRRMGVRQLSDVLGIVEESITLDTDEPRIKLTEADQTSPPWSGNVCPPLGASHHAATGMHRNPAIDNGEEMSEGNEVQHMSGPRSVDAAEHDVAVKQSCESLGLDDAELKRLDLRVQARPMLTGSRSRDVDLGPHESRVESGRVEQPVQVDLLNTIEIEDRNRSHTHPHESFGHDRPHAPCARDAHA
jgi:hypothetical protein